MTSVFAFFTRDGAAIYFPGAPFILALFFMVIAASIVVVRWDAQKERPAG
jgi:DHA1 family tetracycline resistance protein-like MFS transporter